MKLAALAVVLGSLLLLLVLALPRGGDIGLYAGGGLVMFGIARVGWLRLNPKSSTRWWS